jgi:hypothetical protein
MSHKHICFDCERVFKQRCTSAECIFEADEDICVERCPRCANREQASRGEQNARLIDCGWNNWDDRE